MRRHDGLCAPSRYRYAIALIGAAIAAGVLAYVVSSFLPRQYEARAILLAAQTNPALNQFGAGAASAAPLTLSPDVLADALQRASASGVATDLDTRGLRDQLTVTTEGRGTSSLLTIAVRDGDPNAAARLADAVAAATIAWDDRRARSALEDLVTSLTAQIEALDLQIAELRATPGVSDDQVIGRAALRAQQQEQLYYARVLASSANGLLDVLQRAETPVEPVAPRPVLNAALAAILALTLVLLFGLLRDLLDTRVRTIDQVTDLTNLPMLAAFPVLQNASRHAPLEAANFLRANLGFALAAAHPKVNVATSAGPSEGKTTVAVALATAFARQDYRTLIDDLDLRKPMVATALGVDASSVRVEQFLDDAARPLETVTVMLGEDQPLDVLPAVQGVARPAERIASGIGSLLARAQENY